MTGRVDLRTDGISTAVANHQAGKVRIVASMGKRHGNGDFCAAGGIDAVQRRPAVLCRRHVAMPFCRNSPPWIVLRLTLNECDYVVPPLHLWTLGALG